MFHSLFPRNRRQSTNRTGTETIANKRNRRRRQNSSTRQPPKQKHVFPVDSGRYKSTRRCFRRDSRITGITPRFSKYAKWAIRIKNSKREIRRRASSAGKQINQVKRKIKGKEQKRKQQIQDSIYQQIKQIEKEQKIQTLHQAKRAERERNHSTGLDIETTSTPMSSNLSPLQIVTTTPVTLAGSEHLRYTRSLWLA